MQGQLLSDYRAWFKKTYPDYEFRTWNEMDQVWLAFDNGEDYFSMPIKPSRLRRAGGLQILKACTKLLAEKAGAV